jgi:hypothetical protein
MHQSQDSGRSETVKEMLAKARALRLRFGLDTPPRPVVIPPAPPQQKRNQRRAATPQVDLAKDAARNRVYYAELCSDPKRHADYLASKRAYRARLLADPEFRKEFNAKRHARHLRRMQEPEYREKKRAADRAFKARQKAAKGEAQP